VTGNKKLLFFMAEEDQNLYHLVRAMRELAVHLPIDAKFLREMQNQDIDVLDRFVFRFAKTVDSMGKRLFPELLATLGELDEQMFFRDMLNKLEKFGILNSAEAWNTYRDRRNGLTHEYPEAEEEKAAAIMDAYEISFHLIDIFVRLKVLLSERLGIATQDLALPNIDRLPRYQQ